MMWGQWSNMGWLMWLSAFVLLALIVAVTWLLARVGSGRNVGAVHHMGAAGGGMGSGRSSARQILDERFARGELSADQYREQLTVLGEK